MPAKDNFGRHPDYLWGVAKAETEDTYTILFQVDKARILFPPTL